MMISNMLTSKKVKVHGMKSDRWTIKDKTSQFRGLINLYKRDKKIAETDDKAARSITRKELKRIQLEINEQRDMLANTANGDKQKLRNTLAEKRSLQLAYQNLPPYRVIDSISQDCFKMLKMLDRMKYRKQQRTTKLIDLKVLYAELDDRIKYEKQGQIPIEKRAQEFLAKVKDAVLKQEAAIAMRTTYNNILKILKRDSIYFDSVLKALQIDGYNQGKCIFRVTEMGQLATEYLDDRKQQYMSMEKEIKKIIKKRFKSMNEAQQQLDGINNNTKYLIRRDSVIDICEVKERYTRGELQLMSIVEHAEATMAKLKDVTMVCRIEEIFPRMQDQLEHRMRLEELKQKNVEDRDTLVNKFNHVQEMFYALNHSMVESTLWYVEEKQRINAEIEHQIKRRQDLKVLIRNRGEKYMQVRTALQQMIEALRNICLTPNKKPVRKVELEEKGKVYIPAHVEESPLKLLKLIMKRLTLVNRVGSREKTSGDSPVLIEAYQKFVEKMGDVNLVLDTEEKEEFVVEIFLEDPLVPSRAEIKTRSEAIYEKFHKAELE